MSQSKGKFENVKTKARSRSGFFLSMSGYTSTDIQKRRRVVRDWKGRCEGYKGKAGNRADKAVGTTKK
jgi:hypothetical protein